MFQESFKGVVRNIEGCFNGVLKGLKEVSRKFCVVFRKFSRQLLLKFCFAILLLHGTHCSFPSRRRACCRQKIDTFLVKLRLGAFIPRSVGVSVCVSDCLSVGLSVHPKNYKKLQICNIPVLP